MTPDQLLRGPASTRSAVHGESLRPLSNEALMASLRPPPDYGSGALRRSMEPHLVEGVSWFLERTPWQRALLSTGLGALVGAGIVITLARLFVPDLGKVAVTTAATEQTALAAPAAAALLAPAATPPPVASEPAASLAASAPLDATQSGATLPGDPAQLDTAPPGDPTPAAVSVDDATEAKPSASKARKAKAKAKRSKKARQQRARKAVASPSLPARWAELYSRER